MTDRQSTIDSTATTWCEKHGIVDRQRVEAILRATARQGTDGNTYFWPSLSSALDYLPIDTASKLFEDDNLDLLRYRVSTTSELCDSDAPLYDVDELHSLLKDFVEHMEYNRDHLIQTGLPVRNFQRSPWLDNLMTNLYFTKLPYHVKAAQDTTGNFEFEYRWPDRKLSLARTYWSGQKKLTGLLAVAAYTQGFRYDPNGFSFSRSSLDGSIVQSVPYEIAENMVGLPDSHCEKVIRMRQHVYLLKKVLLAVMAEALQAQDVISLWDHCERALKKTLTIDDVLFLREFEDIQSELQSIDRSARRRHDGSMLFMPEIRPLIDEYAGGLSGIFKMILHLAGEIELRRYAELKESIGDFILSARSNAKSNLDSYFLLIAKGHTENLHAALDSFELSELNASAYARRLQGILTGLRYRVRVSRISESRNAAKLWEITNSYMVLQATNLDSGGELLPFGVIKQELDSIPGLRHSPDFSSISVIDESTGIVLKPYYFNPDQRPIVQILWREYANGQKSIHEDDICKELHGQSIKDKKSFRVRDKLRSTKALGKLIVNTERELGGRRGHYRLNPPTHQIPT